MAEKDERSPMQIKPGTKEMEAHLQAGYQMSIAEAERIVKAYEANPVSLPYEKYERAVAMLEAFKARPQVISKTPGWKRRRVTS